MVPLIGSKTTTVVRFRVDARSENTDTVAEEEPLEIKLSHHGRTYPVAITMRTPGDDLNLAIGFLYTEGLLPAGRVLLALPTKSGVQKNSVTLQWPPELPLELRRVERHTYTSSSCGVCGKTSLEMVFNALPFPDNPTNWTVPSSLIPTLPPLLRGAQELFKLTGGIHAAGLFDLDGKLLHFAEDVGRHNALDKLLGHYYQLNSLPLDEHLLILSGRASFELLQKAAMAGIRLIASVGAPSSLAVELAEDQGITLCGFVRVGGFNCYCGSERLIL